MPTRKRGDRRADGRRFWSYEKRNGGFYEKWLNPSSFERAKGLSLHLHKLWRKRKQAEKRLARSVGLMQSEVDERSTDHSLSADQVD